MIMEKDFVKVIEKENYLIKRIENAISLFLNDYESAYVALREDNEVIHAEICNDISVFNTVENDIDRVKMDIPFVKQYEGETKQIYNSLIKWLNTNLNCATYVRYDEDLTLECWSEEY